jgi:hypothetical protein
MENNKYAPLNESEYTDLKNTMSEIGAYLPENKAPYIWSMFNRLRDENETQPCTCASSGGHWKRAVDFINEWLKGKA